MQKATGEQTTFFDLAVAARGSSNRVLETIATEVDCSEAGQAIEATYSPTGRSGHRVAVMLRIMILQHLYGLSDPQAEVQIIDRLSFQKFLGLRAEEKVPDETAICRFRERLLECQMQERLLEILNAQWAERGYLVKRTMLVDATLVESSRQRPSAQAAAQGQAPDAEARYTRKHGRSYYGYKAHVSVDGRNQLICQAKLTGAQVDDSQVFAELIDRRPAPFTPTKLTIAKPTKLGWPSIASPMAF